jgi:hypothetical protein
MPQPPRPALSSRERARLAEKLRSRDPNIAIAALAEIARLQVRDLIDAVDAQLAEPRLTRFPAVVIEALKTLGALGASAHLDRAEARLPPSFAGWVNVARQNLPKP